MPRSFDPGGHKNKIDRIEAMWNIRLNRQKIYKYRDFCASGITITPICEHITELDFITDFDLITKFWRFP